MASLVGMAPQGSSLSAALHHDPSSQLRCRVLCIGLGGGSLPLFLSHHFPGMEVDVVEIDQAVITAARTAMGFPQDRYSPHALKRLALESEQIMLPLVSATALFNSKADRGKSCDD